MKAENWKAIAKSQAIQLDQSEQTLLDLIQVRLGVSDREFLDFLIVVGKFSTTSARLRTVALN